MLLSDSISNDELVSVIVPIYNAEKFIKRTVGFITAQSYHNIEIILVNDGSTDNTGQILKELAESDTRIKVIEQENRGQVGARNTGISACNGAYVTFADHDDVVSKDFIKILYHAAKLSNADIVQCEYQAIKVSEIEYWYALNNEKMNETDICMKEVYWDKNTVDFFSLIGNSVWDKLFRRELIGDNRFDEDVYINEDRLFLTKLAGQLQKITYVNAALYGYVEYVNSGIHGIITAKRATRIMANERVVKEFIKSDLKPSVKSAKKGVLDAIVSVCEESVIYGKTDARFFTYAIKKARKYLPYVWKGNYSITYKLAFSFMAEFPYLFSKMFAWFMRLARPKILRDIFHVNPITMKFITED